MGRFLWKYVTECLQQGQSWVVRGPPAEPSVPFKTVHMDHLGPFARSVQGNRNMLMLVDGFTKFTVERAIRTVCSSEVIDKLNEMFGEFGYPRHLLNFWRGQEKIMS